MRLHARKLDDSNLFAESLFRKKSRDVYRLIHFQNGSDRRNDRHQNDKHLEYDAAPFAKQWRVGEFTSRHAIGDDDREIRDDLDDRGDAGKRDEARPEYRNQGY